MPARNSPWWARALEARRGGAIGRKQFLETVEPYRVKCEDLDDSARGGGMFAGGEGLD